MNPRSPTYRSDVVEPVLRAVAAGECCSVVGVSGVGKSNVVQQLMQPEVIQYYLPQEASVLRIVYIDTNLLVDWGDWGIFEGLADVLLRASTATLPDESRARLSAAHSDVLTTPGNTALAFRHCAAVLAALCQQQRVVLLFDEFDPLLAALHPRVLRQFRGLRDRHKYRLMYVTFSREPLGDIRANEWDDVEPFLELFSLREIGIGPLGIEDAVAEANRGAAWRDIAC